MTSRVEAISIKGQIRSAPALEIQGRTIVISGRWMRIAEINDEYWDPEPVSEPQKIIAELKRKKVNADLLVFSQRLTDPAPQFDYKFEWDNAAVIPITSFKDWWENTLSQDTRKNMRKAEKKGVVVRPAEFDDTLVTGIKQIYDETPVRQGRPFWHYQKEFASVKRENSSYLNRSIFVGAFLGDELIGFLKMVFIRDICCLMQIVSKNQHQDKRPTNALIAKAVEICEQRNASHFVYGKFVYGSGNDTSLTEFKRRNGFQQINYPRYYIPLSAKGSFFLACNLHLGAKHLIPGPINAQMRKLRSWIADLKAMSASETRCASDNHNAH